MAIRPKLVTKAGGVVVSYHDASLFYATKGDGVDKLQESMPDTPYGIINSKYGQHSLELRFDEEELTCYIKPGVFHVYGRQIEITEELEVYDFHATVESRKMFCTVYAEISLEDYTHQMVSIKLDIAGASFKNFRASGTQDDLYKLDHGVFQVPLARFTYTPVAETHFQDSARVIPFLADETRNNAKNLIGNINNVPISTLMEMRLGVDNTTTGKFEKASNVDALAIYNSIENHGPSSGGYSLAQEAQKLGIGPNANQFDAALTNIYTTKRTTLMSLDGLGGSSYSISKTIAVDWSHVEKIRIGYTKGSFTSTWVNQYKGLFSWWNWQDEDVRELTCDLINSEIWRSERTYFELALWIRYHEVGRSNSNGMFITYKSEYDSDPNPEDVVGSNGGDTRNVWGKRLYALFTFSVNTTAKTLTINVTSKGMGPEYGTSLFNLGTGRMDALRNTSNRGNMIIDVIYKGDAKV